MRNPSRRPTHPGAILREDILPSLGISQAALAEYLGVSRLTVSEILLEKRAVSAEMAMRISKAIGGSPESWLLMQSAVDLWDVAQRFKQDPAKLPKPIPNLAFAWLTEPTCLAYWAVHLVLHDSLQNPLTVFSPARELRQEHVPQRIRYWVCSDI